MATFEINYKSDFTLVMGFTLAGVAVPLPVGNFRIVFRTQEYGTEYECSRINGEYVNCKDNGNDTLLCIFDRHGLRPGALHGEVFDYIPDNTFPDGSQLVVTPSLFDIELVEGAGNTSEGVTAEVVISVEEVVEQARDAALAAENAAESASDAADRANDAAEAATEAVADIDTKLAAKQDTLVSGQNIKTINNLSLLGPGNIDIQGGGEQVQSDWAEADTDNPAYIKNKPTLATVATSGSYNDLSNKPTIPAAVTVVDALNSTSAKDALSANQGRELKKMLDEYCPIIKDTRSSAVAEITGVAPFDTLVDGQRILLYLKYGTAQNSTLQLTLSNGTTVTKNLMAQKSTGSTRVFSGLLKAGWFVECIYSSNENFWLCNTVDTNTIYAAISQSDVDDGTSTTYKLITAKLLVANFAKKRTYVDNSADASVELAVTTYNDLGTLSTWKTITLPATYDRADEFIFRFECNDADLSPVLPAGVVMADNFDFAEMAVGVTYQVSIMDGVAAYLCITPNS